MEIGVAPRGGEIDMTKLIVASPNFAKEPQNS
jgi:hypothetical protein